MKRLIIFLLAAFAFTLLSFTGFHAVAAAEARDEQLDRSFREVVQPFLANYCQDCHGKEAPKAKLDLTTFATVGQIGAAHQTWQTVLERLQAAEMPPVDGRKEPTAKGRQ